MTDFVWVGGTGAYLDPGHWQDTANGAGPPAGPPTLADTGTIADGATVTVDGVLAGLGSGLVGGSLAGTLDIGTGGILAVGNSSSSELAVGGIDGGYLNVAPGGALLFQTTLAASEPAVVFGLVSIPGGFAQTGIANIQGTLDANANEIVIGADSASVVTVDAGGTMTSGAAFGSTVPALDIGETAQVGGALGVSGAGSTVDARGLVAVGDAGMGTLTVQDGGTFDGGFQAVGMAIGLQAGSSGTVTVGTGGVMTVTGPLEVGAFGAGTLLVESGGTVGVGYPKSGGPAAIIEGQSGSSGTVSVNGAGALLGFAGNVTMGDWSGGVPTATGQIDATNGGSVLVSGNLLFDGTIAVDAASRMEVSAGAGSAAGTGALVIDPEAMASGVGTIAGDVVNDGTLKLVTNSYTLPLIGAMPPVNLPILGAYQLDVTGNIEGTGTDLVTGYGNLSIGGAVASGQTIVFDHQGAFGTGSVVLTLADPAAFAGTITGIGAGDTLALDGASVDGGSLEGTIGGAGSLELDGFTAALEGVSPLPFETFSYGGTTTLVAAGGLDTAALAGPLSELTPASGVLNAQYVTGAGALPPAVGGALNAAVYTGDTTTPGAGTIALPAGYQAGFGGTLLSDANGNALLEGASTMIATGGNDTLIGAASFFLQNPATYFAAGPGGDSIVAPSGGTVIGGVGNDTIQTSGSIYQMEFHDQLAATAIAPGAGNDLINALGEDTIYPGGGSDTVFAYGIAGRDTNGNTIAHGALAAVGTGQLFLINGTGPSTVIGGNTGTDIVNGGAGGGLYGAGGGGGSVLVAGSGAATLFGVAAGDVLFAGGSAGDVLVAGSGNETLSGLGSTGANTYYAGAGDDLLGGGAGAQSFFAGACNATMVAGGSGDLFAFVEGDAGGTDLIEGFSQAAGDRVTLQGYGADAVQAALGSATVAGGSTAIALADHTTILFAGVTDLTAGAFV